MLTTTKVVVFKEGNGEYAIDVEFVGSIERMSHINPIPQQPSYVKGLVLVRDELVPVFDLHEILYGSSLRLTDQSRLIIIHTNVFPIALIIEEAKELIEIEQESMKQIDLLTHKNTLFCRCD